MSHKKKSFPESMFATFYKNLSDKLPPKHFNYNCSSMSPLELNIAMSKALADSIHEDNIRAAREARGFCEPLQGNRKSVMFNDGRYELTTNLTQDSLIRSLKVLYATF